MMINFEVIDAGLSGLRVIYISVLGKKKWVIEIVKLRGESLIVGIE